MTLSRERAHEARGECGNFYLARDLLARNALVLFVRHWHFFLADARVEDSSPRRPTRLMAQDGPALALSDIIHTMSPSPPQPNDDDPLAPPASTSPEPLDLAQIEIIKKRLTEIHPHSMAKSNMSPVEQELADMVSTGHTVLSSTIFNPSFRHTGPPFDLLSHTRSYPTARAGRYHI